MPTIQTYQGITPKISNSAYIAKEALVIGKVTIGEDASIWPMSVVRGDVNEISIGRASNIQDGCVLHCTHDGPYSPGGRALSIGEHNTIGHKVTLHACTITDFCLVGIGSILLDGVYLEPYTMIAAGSLVPPNKRLEGGYLWMGNPIKKARLLTEEEKAYLAYSAKHYINLKNNYLKS